MLERWEVNQWGKMNMIISDISVMKNLVPWHRTVATTVRREKMMTDMVEVMVKKTWWI